MDKLQTQQKMLSSWKGIVEVLQKEMITQEDFVKAFKTVLEQIKTIEAELIKTIGARLSKADADFSHIRQAFEDTIAETKKANDSTFAQIKQRSMESIDAMFRKMDIQRKMDEMYAGHEAMMAECEAKMPDTEKMMKEMMDKMPPETPESVRDKLESIQEEEQKLAISSIAHLEKKLKELEKRAGRVAPTGGFNYSSMDFHIIDDETPSGTVNGVTTAFTLANTPNPTSSLKVYVNGQRMRVTTDYTFSGNTITFLTAPPTGSIILCDYRI